MATEVVKVFVLYCGQAMTNWIEYYDDETKVGKEDTPPTATALFDLGKSNTHKVDSSTLGLHWLLNRIKGFYDKPTGQTHIIDFVAFSHSDSDHWGMIGDFIQQTKGSAPSVKVGTVVRSGMDWAGTPEDEVKRLIKERGTTPEEGPIILESYRSDYRSGLVLFEKGGCTFKSVIANTVLERNRDKPDARDTVIGNRANDSSLMMAIELGKRSVILPGDATWVTMEEASKVYGTDSTNRPAPCYAMALPHHGALATALRTKKTASVGEEALDEPDEEGGQKESTKDWSVLTTFRDHIKPKCIVASANRRNTYRHPRLELFAFFETKKRDDEKMAEDVPHKIIAYDTVGVFAHDRSVASRTTAGADGKTPDAGSDGTSATKAAPSKGSNKKKTVTSDKKKPEPKKKRKFTDLDYESSDDTDEDFDPLNPHGPPKKKAKKSVPAISDGMPLDIEHYHIEYALFSEKTRPPTMTVWKPAPLGGGADVAIFTMVGPDPAVPGGAAGGGDDVGG